MLFYLVYTIKCLTTLYFLFTASERSIPAKVVEKNHWAGFKRETNTSKTKLKTKECKKTGTEAKKTKKEITGSKFVCLKCGAEFSRGCDFYKVRHWQQKHKNEDSKQSLKNIDHANRSCICQRHTEEKSKKAKKETQLPEKDVETESQDMILDNDDDLSFSVSSLDEPSEPPITPLISNIELDLSITDNAAPAAQLKNDTKEQKSTVQRDITTYFGGKNEEEEQNTLSRLQTDVNRILLTLEAFTSGAKDKQNTDAPGSYNEGIGDIKGAANLLQVSHPDFVVDVLRGRLSSDMRSMPAVSEIICKE